MIDALLAIIGAASALGGFTVAVRALSASRYRRRLANIARIGRSAPLADFHTSADAGGQ